MAKREVTQRSKLAVAAAATEACDPPETGMDGTSDVATVSASVPLEPTDPVGSPEEFEGTDGLLEQLKEQLQAESAARCKVEASLRKCEAELKIFVHAEANGDERVRDLELKLRQEERAREAAEEWRLHVRKLIVALEDLHWDRARTQTSHDANGWIEWIQKYETALEPLVRQSRG